MPLIEAVFSRARVLDHEVGTAFRANRRWGKRDRHFIAESVWETVRWRRALAWLAESERVEDLLAVAWQRSGFEVPDWWSGRVGEAAEREAGLASQPRAVRESVPDWLDARAEAELGERWGAMISALNRRAPVYLRVNRLEATVEEVCVFLEGEGVKCEEVDGLPDGLLLEDILPKRLAADPRWEIQDGGSQLVAPFLEVEPGMRVIDACAGAGGKTLHLAALMEGKGELVAMDVSERKLEELKRRAARAGVRNLRVERWSEASLRKWRGWADRVLIDAPCSGLGTLRRQPDLKWRLDEPLLEKVRRTQRRLLDHYPELLREGGKFVYATCSVLPCENGGQVTMLRERDPRWELEAECAVDPTASGFDGFYMARLGR